MHGKFLVQNGLVKISLFDKGRLELRLERDTGISWEIFKKKGVQSGWTASAFLICREASEAASENKSKNRSGWGGNMLAAPGKLHHAIMASLGTVLKRGEATPGFKSTKAWANWILCWEPIVGGVKEPPGVCRSHLQRGHGGLALFNKTKRWSEHVLRMSWK